LNSSPPSFSFILPPGISEKASVVYLFESSFGLLHSCCQRALFLMYCEEKRGKEKIVKWETPAQDLFLLQGQQRLGPWF
jgi:hypothetical protein